MGKLQEWIDTLYQTLTRIGGDIRDIRDTKEDLSNKVTSLENPSDDTYPTSKAVTDSLMDMEYNSSTIKLIAINNIHLFYTPGQGGDILGESIGTYFIPKDVADTRTVYKGTAHWIIEPESGLNSVQELTLIPMYGDIALSPTVISITLTKEYSLKIEYQLEFLGDIEKKVGIVGNVEIAVKDGAVNTEKIEATPVTTLTPLVGDREFRFIVYTSEGRDRTFRAMGGEFIQLYTEYRDGGQDPDPPPAIVLEDYKRNTIYPNCK